MIRNQLAETYIQAGQPDAALQPLFDSLSITEGNQESAEALYLLSVAYQDLERPEQAVSTLERALRRNYSAPWAPEGFEALGKFYARLNSGDALDRLNEVVQSNPQDPGAYYIRGQLLAQMGLASQAFNDFDASLSLGFDLPQVFAARGRVAQLLGRSEEALSDFAQARWLDPQNARYHAYMGDYLRSVTRYQPAAESLGRALSLEPESALTHHYLGLLYLDLRLFPKAIEAFDHAISLDPALADSSDGRIEAERKQELFTKSGLATPAFKALSRSYSLKFSPAEFYTWRGRVAQIQGRGDEARNDFSQAVFWDPKNAESHAYLGDYLRTVDEYQPAAESLERALSLDPELFENYQFRGLLRHDLGRFQEALLDFNHAISLDPERADAYPSRAKTYLQLGRIDQAFQDLNRAIALNPLLASAFAMRSRVLLALGRDAEAAKDLEQAKRLSSG
jgi:tetratricopeptide (TPR) repeat protein